LWPAQSPYSEDLKKAVEHAIGNYQQFYNSFYWSIVELWVTKNDARGIAINKYVLFLLYTLSDYGRL